MVSIKVEVVTVFPCLNWKFKSDCLSLRLTYWIEVVKYISDLRQFIQRLED